MAYTATQLITNAYYLSGVVSRGFQTVRGDQTTDGLSLLNDLLGVQSADTMLIPYFQEYELDAVIGQELYFIENLLNIETFTFNLGVVRYSSIEVNRKAYFGAPRVDGIQSLPFSWHAERVLGGTNLYLYFLPQAEFVLKIWGNFALDQIDDLQTDLSEVYERFYITYMMYALAEYICNFNQRPFPQQNLLKLRQLETKLLNISPPDLTGEKISTFSKQGGMNWGDVNLGKGWRPL
ncbi:MAG: hypothetical protein A3E87_01645 [Gammaproteobacteria bacterium RIFCSPHIGHO2_12_FULL_35_23]|nr:MAG: hypothetical protein A3E87_01645 [Gammaproteobacteria bacterium RIFCSPHIGHO2_12_FULL_35_23]